MEPVVRRDMAALLALLASRGEIDAALARSAVAALCGDVEFSLTFEEMIRGIEGESIPDIPRLADELRSARLKEARKFGSLLRSGAKPSTQFFPLLRGLPSELTSGWHGEALPVEASAIATKILAWSHLSARRLDYPLSFSKLDMEVSIFSRTHWIFLERAAKSAFDHLCRSPSAKELPGFIPEAGAVFGARPARAEDALRDDAFDLPRQVLPEEWLAALWRTFSSERDPSRRSRISDAICTCPDKSAAQYILRLLDDPHLGNRAETICSARFGELSLGITVRKLLGDVAAEWNSEALAAKAFGTSNCLQALAAWSVHHGVASAGELFAHIDGKISESKDAPTRISKLILDEEKVGIPPAPAPARAVEFPSIAVPEPAPSLWDSHIQPFFVANWYMIAGIIMMVGGSSLLAFYTWDKHWLLRYTIVPLLFGAFTSVLAWSGRRLMKMDRSFAGMSAMLAGAAVSLLPVNFMAIALLSSDAAVNPKSIAVPLMAAAYLIFGGLGLWRWCSQVEDRLGLTLGSSLLFLNFLVAVGPLARALGLASGDSALKAVIACGFYAGLVVVSWSTMHFSEKILTADMAREKRVPWFFGATITVTMLQVFAWEHAFMKLLPKVQTYAAAMIIAGWLILYAERRALKNAGASAMHGAESFIGFALTILGLMMGAPGDISRISCLLLAAAVWMHQAVLRRHSAHSGISVTLFALAVASVGLLPGFPSEWRPGLGLAIAALCEVALRLLKRPALGFIRESLTGLQTGMIPLTAVFAVLVQLLERSSPILTAMFILASAAFMLFRAFSGENARWVYTAAGMLLLSLPYLGCMDVSGRSLDENSMDFGIALLSLSWMLFAGFVRRDFVRGTVSTVVLIYGVSAAAAATLRTISDGPRSELVILSIPFTALATPPLLILSLLYCTRLSRSLLPPFVAAYIAVLMYFEIRPAMEFMRDLFAWGSGIGSAACAVALVGMSFAVARSRFPSEDDEPGEKFFGVAFFPFRRFDHSLFSWPMLCTSIYLGVKAGFHNGLVKFMSGDASAKTGLALLLCGMFWMLMALQLREYKLARLIVHFAWINVLCGVFLAYWKMAASPTWDVPALIFLCALQAFFSALRHVGARFPACYDLFNLPTLALLRWGSLAAMLLCIAGMVEGRDPLDSAALLFFLSIQMIWHGIGGGGYAFGTALLSALVVATVSWSVARDADFIGRLLSPEATLPLLCVFLTVHALHVALEQAPALWRRLRDLALPIFVVTAAASVFYMPACIVDAMGLHPMIEWSPLERAAALLLLVLTSRATSASPPALCAAFASYILCFGFSPGGASWAAKVETLCEPLSLSLLSLFLGLTIPVVAYAKRRWPWVVAAPFIGLPLGPTRINPLGMPLFAVSSIAMALLSELHHCANPVLRNSQMQLAAPFIGAGAMLACAWVYSPLSLSVGAAVLVAIGDVHVVDVLFGERLAAAGLSRMHGASLGLALSMLLFTVAKSVFTGEVARRRLDAFALVCGALVLAFVPANYFSNPDIGLVAPMRFLCSGSISLLAALYFRRASKLAVFGGSYSRPMESGYHFGTAMAIWCFTLLVPGFRRSETVLVALGLPSLYFLACAEFARARGLKSLRGYVESSSAMCYGIFALYASRALFQMMIFPESAIETNHYHYNSPVLAVAGLILLRLHSLGASPWAAFYGGSACATSLFFAVSSLPRLSPFTHQVNAAWLGIGIGHFLTLGLHWDSPARSFVRRLGGIGDELWSKLEDGWLPCMAAALQLLTISGLVSAFSEDSLAFAPLLAAGASVLVHHGILTRSPLLLCTAGMELLLALHADYITPSLLGREQIVIVLLAAWALLLLCRLVPALNMKALPFSWLSSGFMAISLLHIVLEQHAWSNRGLWSFAFASALAACTPCGRDDAIPVAALKAITSISIPWIAYFSQSSIGAEGLRGVFDTWALIVLTSVLLAEAGLVHSLAGRIDAFCGEARRRNADLVLVAGLSGLAIISRQLRTCALWVLFPLCASIQVLHYSRAFEDHEFVLYVLLCAGFAVLWYSEGLERKSFAPFWMAQLSAALLFVAVRRHLWLTIGFWNLNYDVWIALGASFALAAARKVLDRRSPEERVPALTSLCLMPALSMFWVVFRGLGVNYALLVLGMHSMIFTFMGRDDRESPFNVAAVCGFIAFVLVVLKTKLELTMLHAYIIPTGLGVMLLVHLFKDRMRPETRNLVRLVTVMTILCSSGYYAVADKDYSWIQISVLGTVCFLAMGLGSMLRVRVYLFIGFGGFLATMSIAMCRAFAMYAVERSVKMTIIGSSVLICGAMIVVGAVLVRTHKARIEAALERARGILGSWE